MTNASPFERFKALKETGNGLFILPWFIGKISEFSRQTLVEKYQQNDEQGGYYTPSKKMTLYILFPVNTYISKS